MPMLTYTTKKSPNPWGPDRLTLAPGSDRCDAAVGRDPWGNDVECRGLVVILGEPNTEWGFIVRRYWGQDAARNMESALVLTVCEDCGVVKAARKEPA